MCTALAYKTKDFYFGRTLDYESSYGEEIVITPRQYPFAFRNGAKRNEHYALIGMAHVAGGYPLYYEAVNEKGLGMAGLNFVGNACYGKEKEGKDNIASFELIPWILGQCSTVKEVRELLEKINVTNLAFHESFPVSPLHWLIADEKETITVEAVEEGLFVYDNPVGVLTNNPPFPQQMFQLNNYMHLSPKQPKNLFSERLKLQTYSRGMGALGLPGDLSSASRFAWCGSAGSNNIAVQMQYFRFVRSRISWFMQPLQPRQNDSSSVRSEKVTGTYPSSVFIFITAAPDVRLKILAFGQRMRAS